MKGHFGAPVWVSAHSLNENRCFLEGNAGTIVFLRKRTSYNTTGWDPKATPQRPHECKSKLVEESWGEEGWHTQTPHLQKEEPLDISKDIAVSQRGERA